MVVGLLFVAHAVVGEFDFGAKVDDLELVDGDLAEGLSIDSEIGPFGGAGPVVGASP